MPTPSPKISVILILLALLAVSPLLEARDKSDVIYMKNGDRITCEIRKLERGQLTVKIDYMLGYHDVDWAEIERIESTQPFQILWRDGEYSAGLIDQESTPDDQVPGQSIKRITVEEDAGKIERDPEQAVAMEQFGRNFWEQLDIRIDVGFSFFVSAGNSGMAGPSLARA